MNRRRLAALLAVSLSIFSASHAVAADPFAPKTRAQVRAELAEAMRTGNMPALSASSLMAHELAPHQYPAHPAHPAALSQGAVAPGV